MGWIKLFKKDINLEVLTKINPTKGNLVYEYNPFRNYRLEHNMYEYKDGLYSLGDLWKHFKVGLKIYKAIRYGNMTYTYYIFPNKESVPEKDKDGNWLLRGNELNSEKLVEWIKNNTPFYSEKTEAEIKYEEVNNKISDKYYERNISRLSDWLYDAKVPEPNKTEFITGSDVFGTWVQEAYEEGNNINRKNLEEALIKIKFNEGWINVPSTITDPYLREAGELTDFISDELNLSINHPVHIIPLYSYDGSVNLIINDGINVPRLINSRFSATGKNTYEVVDRKGNNDTNIYDQGELFDIDTSLYKRVTKIPKIEFKGVSSGGSLKIGNYYFYFKLSDADGNETDFIGESGLVSIFIGFNDPLSVTTGEKNLNSFKLVNFQLSNIDNSYDYVTVYYSRSTSEGLENSVTEYVKIDKKYTVNNAAIANIIITGFENTINIAPTDINLHYNIVDSAHTSAVCLNMLFMGNVHKPDIPYTELSDLSLRFLPYLKEEDYGVDIDHNYIISTSNRGYIDPKFIYEKTGYWGNEIYRFGIVYILKNGELSPVFNIRGGYNVEKYNNDSLNGDSLYSKIPVFANNDGVKTRIYINYHEEKFTLLLNSENSEDSKGSVAFENVKGVVSFNPSKDTDTIYSIDFRVDDDTILELKKHVRGYFFVRQTRIPTILALGITIGIDKESHTPTIPTVGGFIDEFDDEAFEKTHVTTSDLRDVNYISEGFLERYKFDFVKVGGIWGWVGKAVATIALVAATAISFGGAAALAGIGIGGMFATTGIVAGAAAVTAVTIGATYDLITGIGYAANHDKIELKGRETKPPSFHKIEEVKESRRLRQDFLDRFILKDPSKNIVAGILCPDYALNQPYYNQIFTGNNHLILLTKTQNSNYSSNYLSNYFSNDYRHFYVPSYTDRNFLTQKTFKVIGIPDGTKCLGLDNMIFRSKAGEAEEAWRYENIADNYKDELDIDDYKNGDELNTVAINTDIIRGNFGPYLAFNDEGNSFLPAETVNIYIPEYSTSNMEDYFYLRMLDNSIFYAITDRYDLQDIDKQLVVPLTGLVGDIDRSKGYQINAYRGDCYLCLFTLRIIRNFNDPSAPYNDEIVDEYTWKDNYNPQEADKYANINLGDVNAILLGMWVTFKVRSSNNLNIRTLNSAHVDETAMSGHPRGYYPYHIMSVEGVYKTPDSDIYNKGFSKSVSDRWNLELPDVPHIKNWFGTRIIYSDIHINDAFKNGFRVFRGSNYRDYTREYGEITKLISLESSLLCVFEHGVALIPVNERAIAGLGAGGNVYINTSNVLPENPKIISDMFGSQWPESVIKVPGKIGNSAQYVYGVDTVAKKIWRTDGNVLECISDFKVQEFLNNNITLGERELTPKIGIRNVKTHYNAFKRDVMFTFYDNTYGFEEKVWNLCWNELLEKFITFYSWVPSYMENINNIPFSFDRNTSKWIAKLGTSHAENSFADGITLTNVIIEDSFRDDASAVLNNVIPITYTTKDGKQKTITKTVSKEGLNKFIAGLSISNRILPNTQMNYHVDFTLERDPYGNHKLFKIAPLDIDGGTTITDDLGNIIKGITLPEDAMYPGTFIPLHGLYFNDGKEEYQEVYYLDETDNNLYLINDGEATYIEDPDDPENQIVTYGAFYTYDLLYKPEAIYSELYYRNSAGHAYADYDNHKLGPSELTFDVGEKGLIWCRDLEIVNKLKRCAEAGELGLSLDTKIGNCKCLQEGKFYMRLEDNSVYAITDIYGRGLDAIDTLDRPAMVAIEPYKKFDNELDCRKYLASIGQDDAKIENIDGAYYYWNENWAQPEMQATPEGTPYPCTTIGEILNLVKMVKVDGYDVPYVHGIPLAWHWLILDTSINTTRKVHYNLPIFKDITGKRLMLPKEEQLNPDKIVTLLNIKAHIKVIDSTNNSNLSDAYYNNKASYVDGTSLIGAGYYESTVAIIPKWNLQFLSTDFWKHGQAGIIDIADDIFPTYWYGKQHPFEFECVVVNDPSVHKIFLNLELVANKAKPESFHYEIIGESYDFAKDKVNMYFRQEAMKALWLYNNADITYDRNFLKVQPRLLPKSADLPHKYYTRQDTINDIEDSYVSITYPKSYDYRHLSGAEIVYYKNRLEYRIWNHAKAVDLNDLSQDDSRSIIQANCQYLEDRWKITINPILVCYKNEYTNNHDLYSLLHPINSDWTNVNRPRLPVMNSPIPDQAYTKILNTGGNVEIPKVLSDLGYSKNDIDLECWLDSNDIYGTNFGQALNRKELDIKDKFMKVRIRYSGEELAIIDFLNTIYRVSYA